MSLGSVDNSIGENMSQTPPTLYFLIVERTLEPIDVALPTDENLQALAKKAKQLNTSSTDNYVLVEKPNPMANPVGSVFFTRDQVALIELATLEIERCQRENVPLTPATMEYLRQLLKRVAGTATGKGLDTNVRL